MARSIKKIAVLGLAAISVSGFAAPEPCRSVKAELSVLSDKLTAVYALAEGTPLKQILESDRPLPRPLTIFLPLDSAFAKVPSGIVDRLRANADLRTQVLLDHAWPTPVDLIGIINLSQKLPPITSETTQAKLLAAGYPQSPNAGDFWFKPIDLRQGLTNQLAGPYLTWGSLKSYFKGSLREGASKIAYADRRTCAGVVHVIESVIARRKFVD